MSIFKTTLRIKSDTPEGRKALGDLRNRDKTRYRSYSDAIIAAVNGYFDRERQLADDPYLETREKEDAFLQRILETWERGAQANLLNGLTALLRSMQPAPDAKAIENDLDTAIDFIDSL